MFLLDTNVISETRRRQPDPQVTSWLAATLDEERFLSAISLTEITHGAHRHPDPSQRLLLQRWIDTELRSWLDVGVLPVTKQIAERAGIFVGERERAGRPLDLADALIAATARQHELVLVTRNTKDFEALGVTVLNPWSLTR